MSVETIAAAEEAYNCRTQQDLDVLGGGAAVSEAPSGVMG